MQIDHRVLGENEPIDVVDVSGPSAGAREAERLQILIENELGPGSPAVLLDLSDLRRMDSAFIGGLLDCRDRVLRRRGTLKLVAQGLPREVLSISHLDTFFEVFEDRNAALGSFDDAPPPSLST